MDNKIVIIGGGIAGISCAKEIRNISSSADITLISGENNLPYYRLSITRYFAMEIKKESLTIHPQSFYEEKRIKLICGIQVSEINRKLKQIKLSNGIVFDYDKLVIATGAHPFVLPVSGSNLKNVVSVRTIEDADYILDKVEDIESCICIGGGTLGLEVAGSIAKRGTKVTLLESSEWLMPRQLNKRAANILKNHFQSIGVEVRENCNVQEIVGENNCEGVKLSTGEVLPAKLVIITAGVKPNTDLAKNCGLKVNRGLVVNNNMQTTDENIFAAGDVAEHQGRLYGLWSVAQLQGKIAAQNAMGLNKPFEGVPISSALKVSGIDMFSIGMVTSTKEDICQYEKEEDNSYTCIVVRDDKIIGSIIIGNMALSSKVKQAIEKRLSFPHDIYNNIESVIGKLLNY